MPEKAKENSKEGLEAFARHFYELLNYGYETGDTQPIRDISGPDCFGCNKWYPVVEAGFIEDDWMAGSQIQARSVASEFTRTPEGRYQVLIQMTQEPLQFYAPGEFLGSKPGNAETGVQMIEATYTGTGWLADDFVTIN